MEFIIDFYKDLDTLNLIIFWGIIIVIILLLIFSFILLNKNKKLKGIINTSEKYQEKDLTIKKEELLNDTFEKEPEEEKSIDLPIIHELPKEHQKETENITKTIETEKKFIAEEHVIEYNNDLFSLSNVKKNNESKEEKNNTEVIKKGPIEMPTGPYQRNVLREMSLSQTSPIGITKPIQKQDKKIEMAKDLEVSLNNEENEAFTTKEFLEKKEIQNKVQQTNEQIKKELTNIESQSSRRTEINTGSALRTRLNYGEKRGEQEEVKSTLTKISNLDNNESHNKEILKKTSQIIKEESKEETKTEIPVRKQYEERIPDKEEIKIPTSIIQNDIETPAKELLNLEPQIFESKKQKTSSEKYLEEVSRKLAEAEVPEEIERTNYELKQEEDAIISYKELMEKKDSIQTIDEEEAVISIEELMNRNNQKPAEPEKIKEDTKLYNISEEEENDSFLRELKQFRNDL